MSRLKITIPSAVPLRLACRCYDFASSLSNFAAKMDSDSVVTSLQTAPREPRDSQSLANCASLAGSPMASQRQAMLGFAPNRHRASLLRPRLRLADEPDSNYRAAVFIFEPPLRCNQLATPP